MKSARTPLLRVAQVWPPSVVSNVPAAEIATHSRCCVVRMGDDRVQDQPARAGLPLWLRWVFAQARDVRPGLAAVFAAEQSRRLGAGIERAVGLGHVPDRAHLGAVRAVVDAAARLRPGGAVVGAAKDGRAVPGVAAAGKESPVRGANEVVNGPQIAERAARRPCPTRGVALDDEGALLGADEDLYALAHRATLAGRSSSGRDRIRFGARNRGPRRASRSTHPGSSMQRRSSGRTHCPRPHR